MLTLIECNPTGCFAYGKHATIPLDNLGVTELTGINHDRVTKTANGCGKTNLLNAICHILYGEDPLGASDGDMVNNVWGHGAWAYLKYKSLTGVYRIVLTRKWGDEYPDTSFNDEICQLHIQGDKYRGTDLYFDEWNGMMWMDRRGSKSKETRAKILASLPLSYERFLTTSYMAQAKGNGFVTGKNKDRMLVISELADMTIWDKANKIGRSRYNILSDKMIAMEGQIAGKVSAMAEMPVVLTEDMLYELEISISELEETTWEIDASLPMLSDEIVRIQSNIDTSLKSINDLQLEYDKCAKDQDSLYSQQAAARQRLSDVVRKIQLPPDTETHALLSENGELSAQYKQSMYEYRRLSDIGPTCDKCGAPQDIKDIKDIKNKAHQLSQQSMSIQSRIQTNNLKIEEIKLTRTSLLTKMQLDIESEHKVGIDSIEKSRQEVIQRIYSINNAISNINTSTRKPLEVELQNTRKEIQNQTDILSKIKTQLHTLELTRSRNDQIAQMKWSAQQSIDADSVVRDILIQEIAELSIAIKGMSDRGIKAHKFGSIIANLNELVKEYISVLTDGQVQVWFSPFREKSNAKDDEDVAAEVSILVREGPKEDIELTYYSGAEKQQITLAIICAFWRLASQQGGGSNILFLDEIFGSFDGPSASLAVRLIEKLRESHFGTIVVVTHDDKVKQMLEYDTRWVLDKRHHISTLQIQNGQ